MPKVKILCVPRFGSQQSFCQRNKLDQDQAVEQAETPSRLSNSGKRGNKLCKHKREKTRSLLKVRLPKLNSRTFPGKVAKEAKTPAKWMLEPNLPRTAPNTGTIDDSAPAAKDVFFFSQRSDNKATNEKEKAKLSVLRTISKMLEENQLIRQRLAALRLNN